MGTTGFTLLDDGGNACLATGMGGVIAPETVIIDNVCQDADNLNICYMDLSVGGPYHYEVKVFARWVQNNINGDWINITETFIENYQGYQHPPEELLYDSNSKKLWIYTLCSSLSTRVAFACGTFIDDDMTATEGDLGSFASAEVIEFKLKLFGVTTEGDPEPPAGGCHAPETEIAAITDLGTFVSEDPISPVYSYNKGISPDPYYLYFDPITNELKITYTNIGSEGCPCAINCVEPEIEDFNLPLCEDELQVITVQATDIIGDPTDISIIFKDPIGNFTDASVHTVASLIPRHPSVRLEPKPLHAQINIHYASKNAKPVNPNRAKYQVLKYTDNSDNFIILKDWSSKKWDVVYDRDLRSGHTYGYAVRFQGEFGEESFISSWETIKV